MGEGQEIFVGRLGKNPELAYVKGGIPICKMSLALEHPTEGKTIWKKVVIWGRLAEACSVQLRKGNCIFIQGQLQVRTYKNSEGHNKISEEVLANKIALSLS